MDQKKTILLKLTGEVISHTPSGLNADMVRSIAKQIKQLLPEYHFSIVIGGGNFFRGAQQGTEVRVTPQTSHYVGMLATVMNGLIIQDIFEQEKIKTALFCALECSAIGITISPQNIRKAKEEGNCLIFTAGTGNPFFTTDTNAVLRALQISANALWKGTKVEGVYTKDPNVYPEASFLTTLSYSQALELRLGIMDLSAFALAQQYKINMRIFNIFAQDALVQAAHNPHFGSTIYNTSIL